MKGLLITVLVALVGFTFVLALFTHKSGQQTSRVQARTDQVQRANILGQRASCFAGGIRTVEQLQVNYDIYLADHARALESGTDPSDRRIDRLEAYRILRDSERIASHRIDYHDASQLAAPLGAVVTLTHFSCRHAYPIP